MKKLFPYFEVLLLIAILIYSCDDTITGAIDDVVIPASNVSYGKYIQPVLTAHCATAGCHDGTGTGTTLILSSYTGTVANYSIVAPGNPSTSKLVWAITGTGASMMPPVNSSIKPLNSNQVQGVKTWISEGAKNN